MGQIDGISANYSGTMVSLTDICLKPLGKDCATQSILQVLFFKFALSRSLRMIFGYGLTVRLINLEAFIGLAIIRILQ